MSDIGSSRQASPRARLILGVLLVLGGLAVIALAVGWIAAPASYFKAPRWVVGTAGAVFVLGGLLMLLPADGESTLNAFLGATMVSAFALVGSWVAFWPGERHFGGAIGTAADSMKIGVGEYLGRAVFGVGAIVLIAFAGWAWWRWWRLLRTGSRR